MSYHELPARGVSMQNVWRFGFFPITLITLITWTLFTSCHGQGTTNLEDSLPLELRNHSDVAMIVQKLRFLRSNDTYFGEKHPKKKSNQAQIIECESELKRIVELGSLPTPPSAVTVTESPVKLEDCVPLELRNQVDVELIVQKLRFLRINDSNFGEKHPGKKSTQFQIRENELALKGTIERETMRSINSDMAESAMLRNSMNFEDTLSQEFRDREDVNLIVLQLLFLRINLTSFRENHPGRNAIQEQIQKFESAILALEKLAAGSAIHKRLTKPGVSILQGLEDRKDVQVIVHKLSILRLNEENFGDEHPKMETMKREIREHEAALVEIIRSAQGANSKSNPFRGSPDSDSHRAASRRSR